MKTGDFVKIGDCVKIVRNHERFWVKVTQMKRTSKGKVRVYGTIDNNLVNNPTLKYGDEIDFLVDKIVDKY